MPCSHIKIMRPFPTVLTLAIAMSATVIAAAQTQPSTLEERMSQSDFRAAGLDHLSPDQPGKYLNEWLRTHGAGKRCSGRDARADSRCSIRYDSSRDVKVESHIEGTFVGWRGQNRIQARQRPGMASQAESGMYDAGKFDNPAVRIKPMLLGSWLMYVEGCGCSVRVQRVK